MSVRFSVVIPLHRDGPRFRRCLDACLRLDYPSFEVIVVGDRAPKALPPEVRLVETEADSDTSPPEKRDAALPVATGEVLAFIDDDAYPSEAWLTAAARYFADPSVVAVGGPGLTPPQSSWPERVGGAVYESPAGSAVLRHRFVPGRPREVDDHPAFNLLVRRDALEAVQGWRSTFYGGEDTLLCARLVEAGHSVTYTPDVRVFHHRRPIVAAHLRQVANVGRHRGFFVRAYPVNSRRAVYFLPVAAYAVLGAFGALLWRRPGLGLGLGLSAYAAVAGETLLRHPPSVALATPPMVVAHHLAYGAAFVRGLFTRELAR